MLSRQSSSSKKYSPAPATATATAKANEQRKKDKKKKKKQSPPRSPLLDLNNGRLSRNNSTSSSISSSMSIDAPKGCLRFFLSNPSSSSSSKHSPSLLHRPKDLSKVSLPKSAPQILSNPSPSSRSKENNHTIKPSSQKQPKNPPCLYQWQSGKKPCSKTSLKRNPCIDLKQEEQLSEPNEKKLFNQPVVDNLTPVGKLVCGFGIDCVIDDNNVSAKQNSATSSKTPPVEASVSPEIQFGSSSIQVSATTPSNSTCYGAGHVVSGVTDRRKCRPRGILTVGSSGIDASDSSTTTTTTNSNNNTRRTSFIPLPTEASVSWVLSPCHENDEDQSNGLSRRFQKAVDPATLDLPSSPSSISNSGKCSSSTGKFSSSSKKTTRITLLSPRTPPEFQGLAGLSFDEVVGRPSFSVSPNATTPNCKAVPQQEDSSVSIEYLGSGNVIQTPKSDDSLSSERRWDPLGLTFKFANLNRTSSTCNNSSESSQMRISWREGLASRIYEMDELDCCCRFLSDNEEEEKNFDHLEKYYDDDDDGLVSPKFVDEEHGKGKEKVSSVERQSTCAESMSIDGDGLIASGDSDWTLCYKNKLFQL